MNLIFFWYILWLYSQCLFFLPHLLSGHLFIDRLFCINIYFLSLSSLAWKQYLIFMEVIPCIYVVLMFVYIFVVLMFVCISAIWVFGMAASKELYTPLSFQLHLSLKLVNSSVSSYTWYIIVALYFTSMLNLIFSASSHY